MKRHCVIASTAGAKQSSDAVILSEAKDLGGAVKQYRVIASTAGAKQSSDAVILSAVVPRAKDLGARQAERA